MGFYNVANGDAPYLTELARKYTLNDNYHQPVMGGTYANQMMFGYADALYYADANGDPATPTTSWFRARTRRYVDQIENPNPQAGTNNWYTQDGYGGGSYTNCSDFTQPGVAPIVSYLSALEVPAELRAERLLSAQQLRSGLHRQRRDRSDQQWPVHPAAGHQAAPHRR